MANQPTYLVLSAGDVIDAKVSTTFLGRLCVNPNDPEQDWVPKDPSRFYDLPPTAMVVESAADVVENTTNNTLGLQLGTLFEAQAGKSTNQKFELEAQTVRTFKLSRQATVLKSMLADPEVGREIRDWIEKGHKLYMIVGFKTCINAKLGHMKQNNLSGKISLSVTEILAVAGVPVPPWLQAKIDAGCDRNSTVVQMAQLFEESIFAVRYREVSRRSQIVRWFRSGEVEMEKNSARFAGPMTYGDESDAAEDDEEETDWNKVVAEEDGPEGAEGDDDICFLPVDTYESENEHLVASF